MLKFFRKYQKIILAVGGTILLVIFLVPQAITALGNYAARQGRTVATFTSITGEAVEVTAADEERARRQLRVLSDVLPGPTTVPEVLGLGRIDRAEHWILLLHEARSHGLVGGPADAETLARDLVGAQMSAREALEQFIQSTDAHPAEVREALAAAQGVRRLIDLYYNAPRISDRRLAAQADRLLHDIDARVVAIAARADREGIPEPTDEQLQAHLEKFAAVAPGEGEQGFGYRLPDRVRLEWLKIDAIEVSKALEGSERLSSLELRQYWLRHKDEFPVPGAASPEDIRFEDVEARVRAAVRKKVTDEAMAEISRFIDSELLSTRRDLPRDGPYYKLPEDWGTRRVRFEALAEAIQEYMSDNPVYRVSIPLPEYTRDPDWKSVEEIRRMSGVGTATTERFGGGMKRLGDIVAALREFGEGNNDAMFVQAGIAEKLTTPNGTIFLVRIIDTDPSHPARSVDDIRDALVNDLKRLADYERIAGRIDEIQSTAAGQGLAAVADQFEGVPPRTIQNIGYAPENSLLRRMANIGSTLLPVPVARDEEAIGKIVDRGREIINRMLRTGKRLDEIPIAERTLVVPVPEKLAVVVVQYTDLRPVVREALAQYVMPIGNFGSPLGEVVLREEMGERDDQLDVFSLDNMTRRYQWQGTEPDRDEGEEESASSAAPGRSGQS